MSLANNNNIQQSITFSRNALMHALRYANLILDKSVNNMLSINKHNHNTAILVFSDGTSYFRQYIQCIDLNIDHILYINRDFLYNLVRTLKPENNITLTEQTDVILVTYNNGQKHCPKLSNPTDIVFPNIDGMQINFNCYDLINKLKFVRHTIAHDDIRHQFKGVSLSIQNNIMSIWSSDGYKLSIIEQTHDHIMYDKANDPVDNINTMTNTNIKCILPKKFIDAICLMEVDTDIALTISGTYVLATIQDISIVMPLIDGKPLDYSPIMKFKDEPYMISINGDTSYIIQAIERAMIGCDEQGWINVEVCKDQIKFITNNIITNTHGWEILDTHAFKVDGEGSFYINANTMIGFLKQFKNDMCIKYYANTKTITVTPVQLQHNITMIYIVRTISKR